MNLKYAAMRIILGYICLLLVLQACQTDRYMSRSPFIGGDKLVYMLPDSLLPEEQRQLKMEFVHKIPDSLATSEQKALKEKLVRVMAEYMKVEDDCFVFNISRKDFVKKGIPSLYYDKLRSEVKTNNRFIKENKIENVRELYKKALEDY